MDAKEFVDRVLPKHFRTSCSDENPCNGFYDRGGDEPDLRYSFRCKRCAALDVIRGESFYGLTITKKICNSFED